MAHIGKNWKLQFRRDLQFFGPNVLGFPEAYMVRVFFPVSPVIPQLATHEFTAVNLLRDNQPPMIWESDWETVGTHTCRLTFSWDFQILDIVWSWSIKIEDQAAGTILSGSRPGQGFVAPDLSPKGISFGVLPALGKPPYYPNPSSPAVIIRCAGWADYNP